jgi:hypothetical protein
MRTSLHFRNMAVTYTPTAPAPRAQKKPGPNFWLSLGIFLIGIGLGIASLVGIVTTVVDTVQGTKFLHTPGTATERLSSGTYIIYEIIGADTSGVSSGNAPTIGGIAITPAEVSITSETGQHLVVVPANANANVSNASHTLSAAVQFTVPTEATYDISIQTANPSEALITHALGPAVRSLITWLIVGAVGGLLFVAGLILIIVGHLRRSRARQVGPYGGVPQPAAAAWQTGQMPSNPQPVLPGAERVGGTAS